MTDNLDYEVAPAGLILSRIGEDSGGNYVLVNLMDGVFEKGMFGPSGCVAAEQRFFDGFLDGFSQGLGL